jgi:hypothetical protein
MDMLSVIKNLQTVREVFVLNDEYSFDSENHAERFVKKLLWLIESSYREGSFYREYEELSDFIYSGHADSLAYFLFTDGNY